MTSATEPRTTRQIPSRRNLLRTAAWATPTAVTALAAPAFAASPFCEPATLNWNNFAVGTRPGTITLRPASGSRPALTATIGITAVTGTQLAQSGTVLAGPQGNISGNYFGMGFAPVIASNTMTVTITFSQPVLSTSFTLLDIDATTGYRDHVQVNTSGFTATPGARIIGAGTATGTTATTGPFRMNEPFSNLPNTTSDGNLGLSFTRSTPTLGSVSFRYFNPAGVSGAQNMLLGLSNVVVDPC